MKIVALAITLIGILILLILLNLSSPLLSDNSSIQNQIDNTKVQIQGKVIQERILYEQTKLIKLDNNIEVLCTSCPNYLNKNITVIGITEKYQNKTQIKVLKVIT